MTSDIDLLFFRLDEFHPGELSLVYRGADGAISSPEDAGHFALRLKLYWNPEVRIDDDQIPAAVYELRRIAQTLQHAGAHHGVRLPIVLSLKMGNRDPKTKGQLKRDDEFINRLVMDDHMVRDEFLLVNADKIVSPYDPDWVLCGVDQVIRDRPEQQPLITETEVKQKYFDLLGRDPPESDILAHWLASEPFPTKENIDQSEVQEESHKRPRWSTNKFAKLLQNGIDDVQLDNSGQSVLENYSEANSSTSENSKANKGSTSPTNSTNSYTRLSSITMQAFRGWYCLPDVQPALSTPIDIDADIVLVVGPNGVGKSSLTEAIALGLTGYHRIADINRNDLVEFEARSILPSEIKSDASVYVQRLAQPTDKTDNQVPLFQFQLHHSKTDYQCVAPLESSQPPEDNRTPILICAPDHDVPENLRLDATLNFDSKSFLTTYYRDLLGATMLQAEYIASYVDDLKTSGFYHRLADRVASNHLNKYLKEITDQRDQFKEDKEKLDDKIREIEVNFSNQFSLVSLIELLKSTTNETMQGALKHQFQHLSDKFAEINRALETEFNLQEPILNEDYFRKLNLIENQFARHAETLGQHWDHERGFASWKRAMDSLYLDLIDEEHKRSIDKASGSGSNQQRERIKVDMERKDPWLKDPERRDTLQKSLEGSIVHFETLVSQRAQWLKAWKTLDSGDDESKILWTTGGPPWELEQVNIDRARECGKLSKIWAESTSKMIREYDDICEKLDSTTTARDPLLEKLETEKKRFSKQSEYIFPRLNRVRDLEKKVEQKLENLKKREACTAKIDRLQSAADRLEKAKTRPDIHKSFIQDINFIGSSYRAYDSVFPVTDPDGDSESKQDSGDRPLTILGHERGQDSTDFSSGQKTQLAIAVLVAQAALLRREYERGSKRSIATPKVATLLVDDLESLHDRQNMLRDAILWRRVAYARQGWQVILCVHDEEVADRLCAWLRPPQGRSLKVVRLYPDQTGQPRVESSSYTGRKTWGLDLGKQRSMTRADQQSEIEKVEHGIFDTLCQLLSRTA